MTELYPGFKKGDRVIFNDVPGTIVEIGHVVKDDLDKLGTLVEFDGEYIPPIMEVPYRFLKYEPTNGININTHCPICRNEWKKTMIYMDVCYDCITCNRTKEDIVEEYNGNG